MRIKMQKLTLHNDVQEVGLLAEWIERLGEDTGLTPDKVFQLNLAMEEAVVNVMNYAFPGESGRTFTIAAEKSDNNLIFIIDDEGVPFDPTKADEPDLSLSAEERPIGGLGIMLVRQFMENVTYERRDGHNRLTLTYAM